MIFVSYSWVNNEPNMDVLNFVAYLREKGFHATCDVMFMQEETAISFPKMMAQKLKEADKVIIILSKEYKEKADSFKGGVGIEYNYIISDIEKNVKKYILVTFDSDIQNVTPDFIKEREVISLIKDEEQTYEKLFYKLYDKPEYIFPEVSKSAPELEQKTVIYKKELKSSDKNKSLEKSFQYKGESFVFTDDHLILLENFLNQDCFSYEDNKWVYIYAKDAIRLLKNSKLKENIEKGINSFQEHFDNIENNKNTCFLATKRNNWLFLNNSGQKQLNIINEYVFFVLNELDKIEANIFEQIGWADLKRDRFMAVKEMIAIYIKIGQIKIEKELDKLPLFKVRIQLLEEIYDYLVIFIVELDNYMLKLSEILHRRNRIVGMGKRWKESVLFNKCKRKKRDHEFIEQMKSYQTDLFEIMNQFLNVAQINEEYFEQLI